MHTRVSMRAHRALGLLLPLESISDLRQLLWPSSCDSNSHDLWAEWAVPSHKVASLQGWRQRKAELLGAVKLPPTPGPGTSSLARAPSWRVPSHQHFPKEKGEEAGVPLSQEGGASTRTVMIYLALRHHAWLLRLLPTDQRSLLLWLLEQLPSVPESEGRSRQSGLAALPPWLSSAPA